MPDMPLLQKPHTASEDFCFLDAYKIQQAFSESRTLEQLQESAQIQIARLTTREFDVLRRVTSGTPNKTIACQLNISSKTVEKYRSSLMTKLRVRTVPDLMRIWLQAHPQELNMLNTFDSDSCKT
jgi:FixJ family two-component response regulator